MPRLGRIEFRVVTNGHAQGLIGFWFSTTVLKRIRKYYKCFCPVDFATSYPA